MRRKTGSRAEARRVEPVADTFEERRSRGRSAMSLYGKTAKTGFGKLILATILLLPTVFGEPIKARPNVLIFFADDQRFDTIHALGNPRIQTPNLDRLVESGTAFTRAYIMGGSSPAVCMPSRAMLHTGRPLYHIEGIGHSISEENIMLGEALRKEGYNTYGIGKWHSDKESFNRSFGGGSEIFFGGMCDHWNVPTYRYDQSGAYESRIPACRDPWYSNELIWRNADRIQAGVHSSDLFSEAAVRFLENYESAAPFFLYVSFLAPHDPRTMPEEYRLMYRPDRIELPPNFMGGHPFDNGELKIRDEQLEDWPRTPEAIRRHIAEYYGMITHLDSEIGRVVNALEERGKLDDTIIVFAGDNGLAVGQHGLMGKQSLYEHSVRVPLVMTGPGIPKNRRSDALCYLFDLYPTLCALTDTPVPESVMGKSLVPAMDGAVVRDHLLLAYCHQMRGIRDERFKLIETVVEGRRTTQLFDLQEDPWELDNLSGNPAYDRKMENLRGLLETFPAHHGDAREQGQIFWKGYFQHKQP